MKPSSAWVIYDWANSAYTTCVMTVFFPILFANHWSDFKGDDQTVYVGWINSLSSLVIITIGPVLGAIADAGGRRKTFMMVFAVFGVVMTAAMWWLQAGWWILASAFYILASVGFMGANIFYDALLLQLVPADDVARDRLSLQGYALGYLGGGLALAVCVVLSLKPAWFGFSDGIAAARACLLFVAVWWLLFTIPAMRYIKERPVALLSGFGAWRGGFKSLWHTFRELRQYKEAWMFLLAYWCYIDGVDTIVRMAAVYAQAIGLDRNHTVLALLLTQFVGFPAALYYVKLARRWGVQTGIYAAIAVYALVCIWAFQMQSMWEFYVLAMAVGLVQGGVQALSRSYFARLIPASKAGEFFGFYNMLGKSAAVVGPALVAWLSYAENSRFGILALLFLFLSGAFLLSRVKTVVNP